MHRQEGSEEEKGEFAKATWSQYIKNSLCHGNLQHNNVVVGSYQIPSYQGVLWKYSCFRKVILTGHWRKCGRDKEERQRCIWWAVGAVLLRGDFTWRRTEAVEMGLLALRLSRRGEQPKRSSSEQPSDCLVWVLQLAHKTAFTKLGEGWTPGLRGRLWNGLYSC